MYYSNIYEPEIKSAPPRMSPSEGESVEKWHKKFAEFIYSAGYNGYRTSLSQNRRDKMLEWRKYGQGDQSVERYKDVLLERDPKERGRPTTAYTNIDFENLKVWPKFRFVVMNIFSKTWFKPSINAIDEKAGDDREEKKWKLWVKRLAMPTEKVVRENAGLPPSTPEYVPDDLEELNFYAEIAGFKLAEEMILENWMEVVDWVSDKDEVKEECIGDIIDFGMCAVRNYHDTATDMVKYEYVDPVDLIIIGGGGKGDRGYRNATAFGRIKNYTIAQVREANPNITEDKLHKLASTWANETSRFNVTSYYRDEDGSFSYDDVVVPVLDYEFLGETSVSVDKRVKINEDKVKKKELDSGKVFKDSAGVFKVVPSKTNITSWFEGKWIIGSDILIEYGAQKSASRPNNTEARSSYSVYEINGPSLTEQARPLIDSIQLSWLKYQHLKATGNWGGILIDFAAFKKVPVRGSEKNALELFRVYNQAGRLFWNSSVFKSTPGAAAPAPAIPLQGNAPANIEAIVSALLNDVQMLREVTGISEMVAAAGKTEEKGLGVQELSIAATHNALNQIIKSWTNVYQRTAESSVARLMAIVRVREEYKAYDQAFGKKFGKILRIGKDVTLRQFGIKVEVVDFNKEYQEMSSMIATALTGGKNGNSAISVSTAMAANRMLKSGTSIKQIEMFIAYREMKDRQAQEAAAQEAEKVRSENVKMENREKSQQELAKIKAESEAKQAEDRNRAMAEADAEIRVYQETKAKEEGDKKD